MTYKIYRYNNYFVIIDRGNYFEEHCENVLVTKKKGTDSVYTIAFLAQNTERATAVSQSFPNINFSDIRDEFDAPYGSIAIWEDWYTANTGVGYITTLLATSGLATEATLLQVLNNMIASQDIEILLVRDTGNADQVIQQIREYDQGTGVWNTRYEDVTGATYVPVGPLEYLDPSAVLNLILTELLDQGLTLDQLQTNTTGLNLEATQLLVKGVLDTLLANFNAEDFATETTLAAQAADIATIEANIALLNAKFNVFGREPEATSTPVAIDLEAYNALLAIQTAVQNIDSDLGTGGLALDATVQATNTLLTTIDGVLDSIKVDTAAMVVDLAAIEVLITTTNSLLTTIDAVIDQIQTNTLNTVNELTSANLTLASILADTTQIKNKTDLLNFIATALEVTVTSSVLPTGAATETTLGLVLTELQGINLDTNGLNQETTQLAIAADIATIETNIASLNTKLNTLGQKASAASAPVVLSTEQEAILAAIQTAVQNIDADLGTGGLALETTLLSVDTRLATANLILTTIDAVLDAIKLDTANLDVALSTIASEATLLLVNSALASIYTNLQLNTISTASMDTKLTSVVRTPNLLRATGAGTIAPVVYDFSVANVGAANGTILGGTIKPGETLNFSAGALNNSYAAASIAYDGTGTELVIIYNS